jgi:ABC-type polysaccharide/polyol phosphate transport system ATPase subunit
MERIRFESVSKAFTLSAQRLLIRNHLTRVLNWGSHQKFFALKDVSFQIGAGEAVAVIGSNGAGKSTLLSVVAGLCPPDTGTVVVNGRVAALLQLGAGFHPDLTGAENIRMNAALLGLSGSKTAAAFDDIVEFSGIGQFIAEPIRTYSSGMMMRLGFAIAVNVDPDILIIDEVLTVGDHAFQVKCAEKILEFKRRGKTLLFVSHATFSVQQLCERALWLDHGEVVMDGETARVAAAYEGRCGIDSIEPARNAAGS